MGSADDHATSPPSGPFHEGLRRPGGSAPHERRLEHLARALGAADDLPIDPDLDPDDPRLPSKEHRAHAHAGLHRSRPSVLAAIFVGGFLGTLGRYVAEAAWPAVPRHFPVTTFAVNTSGAFLLGLTLTLLLERLPQRRPAGGALGRLIPRLPTPRLRTFVATGLLGGWTTYSTFVVESVTLAKDGRPALAVGYLAVTLVCGLTGIVLGMGIGRSRAAGGGPATGSQPDATADVGFAEVKR